MKKTIILHFILCAILFYLCGCFHTSGTIVNMEHYIKKSSVPLKYPLKFYISSIKCMPSSIGRFFTEQETNRWRDGLIKFWPDRFVVTPSEGLNIDIYIFNHLGLGDKTNAFSAFLMGGTFGIIPYVSNYSRDITILIKIGNFTHNTRLTTDCRDRGWFIFPFFYWLIPEKGNKIFTSTTIQELSPCSIEDERLKDFLSIFVAELHNLQTKELLELYLSQTQKTVLLEK